MTLRYLREPGTVIGTAAEFTARNLVLLNRQLGTETDTGKSKLGDATTAWNSLAYLPGGGGDVTGIVPIANPAGGAVVEAESPFFGEGTIQVVQMDAPAEGDSAPSVLAFKVAGSSFPSFILNSDMANTGLCLGDGDSDPSDQVQITVSGGALDLTTAGVIRLGSFGGSGVRILSDDCQIWALISTDARFDSGVGPVLTDTADGHTYRMVSTNGVLVLEQLT